MNHLYNESRIIDKENVSIQSAFICMLHLANEKGLIFIENSNDQSIEADFVIEQN
jgi:hypothetical protein